MDILLSRLIITFFAMFLLVISVVAILAAWEKF